MFGNFEPFENAEEVWFWFCNCMIAKNEGWRSRGDYGGKERCCEVNDIYRIVKKIKFHHALSNRHFRVLLKWGNLSVPPYYDKRAKNSEIRLWSESMAVLDTFFREKRII